MSLKFNCSNPECRQRVAVEEALAGTAVTCPACGTRLHAPETHDLRFACTHRDCGQHLVVDVAEAGRFMKCPACDKVQRVPGDPPQSLAPAPNDTTPGFRSQPVRRWAHEDQFVAWFFVVALVGLVGFGLAKISTLWMQPGFPPGQDAVFEVPRNVVLPVLGFIECAVAALCAWGRVGARRGAGGGTAIQTCPTFFPGIQTEKGSDPNSHAK